MKGGRVPQTELDFINVRIFRVRMLMDQCMAILDDFYKNPDDELSEASKMLIDEAATSIEHIMNSIAIKLRQLKRGISSFTTSSFYKKINNCQRIYLELWNELYGGYTFYDHDIGVEPYVRKFYDSLTKIQIQHNN